MRVLVLIWAIWYHLKHVEPFQTIENLLGLFGTIWDHLRPYWTTWDYFSIICDYLGPVGTSWDQLGPVGTI